MRYAITSAARALEHPDVPLQTSSFKFVVDLHLISSRHPQSGRWPNVSQYYLQRKPSLELFRCPLRFGMVEIEVARR